MNIKINKILTFAATVFFLSQPSVNSFDFTIKPAETAEASASAATTDYSWLTPPTKPEQPAALSTPTPKGLAAEQPATAAPAQKQDYSWLKLPAENPTAPTFAPTTGGLGGRVIKTPSNGGWLKFMLLTAGPKIAMDLIFDIGLVHLINEKALTARTLSSARTKLANRFFTNPDLRNNLSGNARSNAARTLEALVAIPAGIAKQLIYYYGQDAYYYLNPVMNRQKSEDVLWQITKELCDKMELNMPNVYVLNCSCPQIFLRGRKSLVLTSAMLRNLNINELTAIIGSELAHRKLNFVAARNTMATSRNALNEGFKALYDMQQFNPKAMGLWAAKQLHYPLLFAPISRQFDYKADALSVEVTGKPWALVSALEKLNKAHRPFFKRLSMFTKRAWSLKSLSTTISQCKNFYLSRGQSHESKFLFDDHNMTNDYEKNIKEAIFFLAILPFCGLKRKVFRDLLSNRPSLNNRIRALQKNFNADPSQGLALQFDAKAAAAKALKIDGNVHSLT